MSSQSDRVFAGPRDATRVLDDRVATSIAARSNKRVLPRVERSTLNARQQLKRFARRLTPYVPGILAHCRYPLGTNLIEGINNKIKVIKRMAYGFRDDHDTQAFDAGGLGPIQYKQQM